MLRLDMNLVFTIINLLILFLLLRKFLFNPINEIMAKRKKLIEEQFSNAAETEKKANALKESYEDTFKNAEETASTIISDARNNAKTEYEKIVSDANVQAGKILASADKDIKLQREATIRQMESEIASLAMSAATKVVTDKSSGLDNEKLYDEFLSEAGGVNDSDVN